MTIFSENLGVAMAFLALLAVPMQERHLCWPPYFFLGPAVPLSFHSRIATVTPESHPFIY